jgi:hypothetical protein
MTKLLLPDGEGTVCRHTNYNPKDDGSFPWERCKDWAEVEISFGEATRFWQWIEDHPRAIIGLDAAPPAHSREDWSPTNFRLYLCGHHANVWRDLV